MVRPNVSAAKSSTCLPLFLTTRERAGTSSAFGGVGIVALMARTRHLRALRCHTGEDRPNEIVNL
jgi:hypothetical protein